MLPHFAFDVLLFQRPSLRVHDVVAGFSPRLGMPEAAVLLAEARDEASDYILVTTVL